MGYEHVIPEFNVRILKRQNPFKLYGSTDTRAFCYVDDAVMATKMVMQTSTTNGGIIHVGNPFEEIQILDLAKKMLDLFNFHPPIEILPAPQGSVSRRCPDISKLNRLTLFKPQIALNTGLVKTFEWYKHRLSTLED
jgi:UDP-glucose 4-epimerase/UDP-glucuronate decarboxylase